ncbi:hypothetical protein ACIQPR_48745 [Streptomyces sp. NPDC091280]|uniref:hypothetical protein n=1 Tax=Streptomyces sp. NPDC091280 TaxID=3365984 RepID=UPI0038043BF5
MRNPLAFVFADPADHGKSDYKMGRASKSATEADRQGWANSDATQGFSRAVGSGGGRRSIFGRRR